jgi:transcriptional regulator with XRE-family HTH domain
MTRNINTRLKDVIEKTGYSIIDFSKKIDVSRQTLYYILSKDAKPGFEVIHGIAMNFPWLNLRWLITGEGTMNLETESKTNEELRLEVAELRERLEQNQVKIEGMEAARERKEKMLEELVNMVRDLMARNKD